MQEAITRRAAALTLGGIASVRLEAAAKPPGALVHQEVDFKAAPARIYDALLDAKQFTQFTGAAAEIQRQAGGSFKLFGGQIEGRSVELAPGRRIVQAWRAAAWKPGFYTIVRFDLTARDSGTRLILDQGGILEEDAEWKHLDAGWPVNYWEPLRKFLDK